MDDQRVDQKGGLTPAVYEMEVNARVIYVVNRETIQILLAPGCDHLNGGVPIDIPIDLVPAELRIPSTDLIVTRRNGEVVAVRRMDEKT
jgi:hypothetical protein